jgi:cysteine desulfurase family protein (TIGR01976 family)
MGERESLPADFQKFPELRRQFPALQQTRAGQVPIFLDGPGGTQLPQTVIDAMVAYLKNCNANHGGVFATSRDSDRIIADAHQAGADLLNAPSSSEIVFGQNMTTLTLHFTRAVSRTLRPGDELMVTRLDHDANVTPWVLAARDAGATIRWIDIHPEDCTLSEESLRSQLSDKTRWLAVCCASNAVGTINDVRAITQWAHAAGARVFLDAVHYAPHAPIDVQAWNCDALACSAYKFFGPHAGILWARRSILEELPAYKLRPVPETLPDRWMTGTQNHEGLAGVAAAVDYLAALPQATAHGIVSPSKRNKAIREGMELLQQYERQLSRRLLEGLLTRPRLKIWGIKDAGRLAQRAPTFSITMQERDPQQIAQHLADRQIYVWNGNMYALGLSERLGLEARGGFLRIGLVHYNTPAEIERLLLALDEL